MVEETGELSAEGVNATPKSWKCKWRGGKKSWLLLKEEALLMENAEQVHMDCV